MAKGECIIADSLAMLKLLLWLTARLTHRYQAVRADLDRHHPAARTIPSANPNGPNAIPTMGQRLPPPREHTEPIPNAAPSTNPMTAQLTERPKYATRPPLLLLRSYNRPATIIAMAGDHNPKKKRLAYTLSRVLVNAHPGDINL
jgi:hypothetical protein